MSKSDIPLHKHTLNLYEGDMEELQDLYPEVGGGLIVRKLVRAHLRKVKAVQEERMSQRELTE